MIELFCDSFDPVPRRILLDIDDTENRVHGGQQLSLWNGHYDSRCFLPIHIYEATSGKPVAVILRPGKTPDGAEVALVLRHLIGHIRARWPAVEIIVRGDRHYGRPEAMAWCERRRVGYIFGLAGNPVLRRQVGPLAEDAALGRLAGEGEKVRRSGEFRDAASQIVLARGPVRHDPPLPDQARRARDRNRHRIRIALPTAYPYQLGFAMLAGRIVKLPP